MATFGAKRTLASVAEQSRFYEYNDRRLAGNDDRQVRDGHPLAIERQTLGRVSAGRTSKGVPLNAAYRRPIGANFGQAHLSAARQTFHIRPWSPVADALMRPTVRPRQLTAADGWSEGPRKPLSSQWSPRRPPGARTKAQQRLCTAAAPNSRLGRPVVILGWSSAPKVSHERRPIAAAIGSIRHVVGEEMLSSRPRWETGQCWHYLAQPLLLPPPPLTETLAVGRRGKSRNSHCVACRPKADHYGWLCRSQTC